MSTREPPRHPRPSLGLLRMGALGDLVLLSSVSQALAPRYRVVLITSTRFAELGRLLRGVDEVVAIDPTQMRRPGGRDVLSRRVGALELLVDFQNKLGTAWLARGLRAQKLRSQRLRTPWQVARALVGRGPIFDGRHQSEINFDLVADLCALDKPPRPALDVSSPDAVEGVILVPGAAHANKRWPAQRYGQLAARLGAGRVPVRVWVGPGEEPLLRNIERAAGAEVDHSLHLSLVEAIGHCAHSAVVVAGDTGPAHVAAALGRPVLSLFGPTSPRRWRPLGPGRVIRRALRCAPCSNHGAAACPLGHHDCLESISVDEVEAACRRLLAEQHARRGGGP